MFLLPWAIDELVAAGHDREAIWSYSPAEVEGWLHYERRRRPLTLPAYLAQFGDA